MSARLLTVVTAAVVAVGAKQYSRVQRERDTLRSQLAELQAQYDQVPAETRRRIERQDEEPYRLPAEGASTTIQTLIGEVRLVAPRGYYTGSAIFVYLPDASEFPKGFGDTFLKETEGEFCLEPAPGSGSGGDSNAAAIISAGLDYNAYQRGEQGYFKCSPAPQLEVMAGILSRLIASYHESMAVTV